MLVRCILLRSLERYASTNMLPKPIRSSVSSPTFTNIVLLLGMYSNMPYKKAWSLTILHAVHTDSSARLGFTEGLSNNCNTIQLNLKYILRSFYRSFNTITCTRGYTVHFNQRLQ